MASQGTGELVAGRYELQETLGKGGMGVVWRAHDRLLRREVAVKEIRFPPGGDGSQIENAAARVMREARAAASLNHPNAVAVFDVTKEQGRAFIVMELIDAPTLSEVVKEQPITPERAAEIGLDVIDVLQIAHSRGLVHRDVKPANVMVQRDGRVKLADFGIVSVKGDPKLTASGAIMGSPQYMAPEQARDETATAATDIWALGAVLYFCVEGKPPFDRGQPIPTLTAVLSDEPKFTQAAGNLRRAISACLRKDPSERPDLSTLAGMLKEVASPGTTPLTTGAPVAPTDSVTFEPDDSERLEDVSRDAASESQTTRPPRAGSTTDRRVLGWAAAILLLLTLVIATVALLTRGDPETPQAQSSGNNERSEQEPTGSVPEGWTRYEDAATGYTIAYPEGWEPISGRGTDQSVDFEDPETGAYMRIDWTDTPGESAVGAWEAAEPGMQDRLPNYERVSIEPTTFQEYEEAAIWEYTWGAERALHAINLGFVTGDYGFALNYQAPEENWDDLQEIFETFKATFRAP
jgi:eukaryotic-like serine/threonine-protein kinase